MARKRAASSSAAPAAKKSKASPLVDTVICITGTLSLPRKALVTIIEENGGSVSGSVTGKTTHLVADSGAQGTTKWNKAKQAGLPIITEEQLHAAIAGNGSLNGQPAAAPKESPPKAAASKETSAGVDLHDAVVCITGTLSVPRKQLVQFIESNGGKVSASVTGKTTHLVADDGARGTTKWNKAQQVGIPIITEEQLREGLLDGEPDEAEEEEEAEEEAGNSLAGAVICITGTLSVTRKEVAKLIEDNGGKVCSTVTGKTTVLIADAGAEGTAKWNKAKQMAISIVTEEVLRDVIAGKAQFGDADTEMVEAGDESSVADDDYDGKPLADMVICQTGTLSVTRKEFIALIENHGGKASSTVTQKTTHLVADPSAEGTTKWNKAKALGVEIITESKLREMIKREECSASELSDDYSNDGGADPLVEEKSIPSTVDWSLEIPTTAYGIFVDGNGMWAGLENSELYHIAPETGEVLKIVNVSAGCKCIVGDMGWVYCGCNDGKVYDITNPKEPRLMYELDTAESIQWMDICDGFVSVSTACGNLSQVNAEGEQVWAKSSGMHSGWMVRSSMQGVFHGTDTIVRKYAFATGELQWETCVESSILFGSQTQDSVFAASDSLTVIDKKTGRAMCNKKNPLGECESYPSAVLLEDGRMFGCSESTLIAYDVDQNLDFTMKLPGEAMSMQYYQGYLYCVAYSRIFRVAVEGKALADARKGKKKKVTKVKASKGVESVQMKTDVEVATGSEDGVLVECVKEGSKVRIRPVSDGYFHTWNVQFPRALRTVGAKFVVDELVEAQSGGFYRTKGSIKRLS